ncbi:hypothetical protein SLS55_003466 [Diplodia seriata]|uniref:Uncharacterized protein n=1 Tax=Diplodia seriata TaxID=420778 RepID=A0ABR3CN31_9PEZI
MAPVGVGDCIAIADVLVKCAKALQDSGGAVEEYQDAEGYATALKASFEHLRRLEHDPVQATPAELGQALSLCEKSLGRLFQRKSKYESSLGKNGHMNQLSTLFRKMQWALVNSKDVKDLRSALSSEVVSAVLVLQTHLM